MSEIIKERGIRMKVVPKDGTAFTITELQDLVDGYIDLADIAGGVIVYDVDGATKNKLYNRTATELVQESNPDLQGFIAGDAVVCTRRMIRMD